MASMTGLDENGEESWDFFHRPLGNRVERLPDDGCSRESLEAKMLSGNPFPYATSVMFPATHDTSDYLNPQKIVPEQIDLDATEWTYNAPYGLEYVGAKNFPNDNNENWYDRLKNHWNPSIDSGVEEPFI